jgi:hypothetical protein
MAQKFEDRVAPAISQLRQALAAVDRAKKNNYPPHVAACMAAALDHSNRATALLARAAS